MFSSIRNMVFLTAALCASFLMSGCPHVTPTPEKMTPVVSAWPAATSIVFGQTLAASRLTGGTASIPGSFAFLAPSVAPFAGVFRAEVGFVPADTANYNAVSGTVSLKVEKGTPVVSWPTADPIAYGQKLSEATLAGGSGVPAGTFAFERPDYLPAVSATPVRFAVTFTPNDQANYTAVRGTVAVAVNKGNPVVVWPAASLTYGQTLADAVLPSSAGTFTFDTPEVAPTVADSGTAYPATFKPADPNHSVVAGTIVVTVGKADPEVTWPAASLTYGQTLADAVLTGGAGAGTFMFSAPTTAPAVTASGTAFAATFTPVDTSNYNILAGTIAATVNKANPVVTWPTATMTYGQTLADAVLTGGVGAGTFTFAAPAAAPTLAQSGTAFPATFTPADANYGILAGAIKVTVNPVAPEAVTWPAATLTYGQTLAEAVLRGGVGAGEFTFDAPTTVPTVAQSGTAFAATFKPADSNLSPRAGTIKVTVNKATPVVTWPTATLTYGQILGQAVRTGGAGAGTFKFDTPATAPAVAQSGPFAATFTPTDTANYNVHAGTILVAVNKANPAVTWPTATMFMGQELGDAAQIGGSTANPYNFVSVPGAFAFDAPATSPTVAQSGPFAATFTPSDTANYNGLSSTISVTVNKANPVVTWPAASMFMSQRLDEAVQTGGSTANPHNLANVPGVFAFNAPGTVLTAVGARNEPATFTPSDVSNYSVVSGAIAVTVSNPVSLAPASATLYEGDTVDLEASSLLAGDTAFTWTPLASTVISLTGAGNLYTATALYQDAGVDAVAQVSATGNVSGGSAVSAITVKVNTVTLNPAGPIRIEVGQTVTLKAATNSTNDDFDWSATDALVATVAAGALYDEGVVMGINAGGPIDITVTGTASGRSDTVAISVAKATPVAGVWPTGTLDYGQTLSQAVFTDDLPTNPHTGQTVPGSWAFNAPDTAPTVADSGTAYPATFTPADTNNYSVLARNIVVTVSKATPAVTWPTATLTYGLTLAGAILTGGSGAGTFTFDDPSAAPTLAESGPFAATFTPSDMNNYNVLHGFIQVTVHKTFPVVTWPIASLTYEQTLADAVLTGAAGDGVFTFDAPATAPTVAQSGTGFAATFTPTDTANYEILHDFVVVTVNKAASSVSSWPTASAIDFGEPLSASILTGGSGTPPGTFAFAEETIVPAAAGIYQASVVFTPEPPNDANYVTVTNNVPVTVNKATPAVTWPTASMYMSQRLDEAVRTGGSAVNPHSSANVPGGFAFDAPALVLTTAGVQDEPATFTPSDGSNYLVVSGVIAVTVSNPVSVAPTSATLYEGDTVDLDASSLLAADATFTWAPLASTVVSLTGTGNRYTVTALHQATNLDAAAQVSVTGDVSGGSATADIAVKVNTVTVSPAGPLPVEVGQTLVLTAATNTRRDAFDWWTTGAAASVTAGSVYNEGVVTGVNAGGPIDITVTGTASGRSATVAITVAKTTPVVGVWPTATLDYGQNWADAVLTAGSATNPHTGQAVAGTWTFDAPATPPVVADSGPFDATFTPTDTGKYNVVAGTIVVTVNKAASSVSSWPTASAIDFGQPLSASTLTGGSGTPAGAFAFEDGAIVPSAGGIYQASVVFTPDDPNYAAVINNVPVMVRRVTVTPEIADVGKGLTVNLTASSTDPADLFFWESDNTLAANVFPHPMDPTQGIVLGASPGTAVITVTGSVTGLKATASITVRYWLNVSQVTGATPVYEPGIYLKEDTHIPGPGTYPGGELSPSGGWGNDTDALDIYYYGDSDLTSRPNFMVSWIVDPDDPNSYVASAYGGFRRFTNITGGSQALVTVVGIYTIAGGNLTYEGLSGPTVFQNTIDFNLDNAAK